MRPACVDHAVALDGGVVGKVCVCAVIEDVYGLYILFIIIDGINQAKRRRRSSAPRPSLQAGAV